MTFDLGRAPGPVGKERLSGAPEPGQLPDEQTGLHQEQRPSEEDNVAKAALDHAIGGDSPARAMIPFPVSVR